MARATKSRIDLESGFKLVAENTQHPPTAVIDERLRWMA